MGARPDLVAASFLAPVLQHFSDLLSKGSRGRSIKAGSLASLHGVALSLERFLAAATAALAAGGAGGGGGDGGAAQQQNQQQEEEAEGVLMWRRCGWPALGGGAGGGPAAAAAEGSGGEAAGSGARGGHEPGGATGAEAAAALLGHLLECWSEAGPSQLAEAPDLVAAQCLTAILRQVLLPEMLRCRNGAGNGCRVGLFDPPAALPPARHYRWPLVAPPGSPACPGWLLAWCHSSSTPVQCAGPCFITDGKFDF